MTIKEIKATINSGQKVELYNGAYEVIKDDKGQYLIRSKDNCHCIGLHGQVGTKFENITNFPIEDFYVGNCSNCYYAKHRRNQAFCSNMDSDKYQTANSTFCYCDKWIK